MVAQGPAEMNQVKSLHSAGVMLATYRCVNPVVLQFLSVLRSLIIRRSHTVFTTFYRQQKHIAVTFLEARHISKRVEELQQQPTTIALLMIGIGSVGSVDDDIQSKPCTLAHERNCLERIGVEHALQLRDLLSDILVLELVEVDEEVGDDAIEELQAAWLLLELAQDLFLIILDHIVQIINPWVHVRNETKGDPSPDHG